MAKDRFRYDVLFHTDLSRDSGISNGRNLAQVNWGNYDLVVIDESHNFRNAGLTYSDKENRYQKLLRKVIQEGVSTKVLMLSATPVNNRFNDLKNQLALAYEGDPTNIDGKLNSHRGIDTIFKSAQRAFRAWTQLDSAIRTTDKLLEMLDYDFFELLDSLTIARSRKHIVSYYDTSAIGKFPKRNAPVSISSKLSSEDCISYEQIADQLSICNLSVYTPLSFLLPGREQKYADRYDKEVRTGRLTQRDRELSLRVLMQINLLKRLESSVDSFRLTIKGIVAQIQKALEFIKGDSTYSNAFESSNIEDNAESIDWEASWGDEENLIGNRVKVHKDDLDRIRWKEELEKDLSILTSLINQLEKITPS